MTKEQEVAEAKKAEAQAEFEASLEGLSDEEKTQKITEKEKAEKKALSHNAEIEEAIKTERKRREEAEAKLEETRRKAKERIDEKKKKDNEDENENGPLTRADMKSMLEEEREIARKEMREEQANDMAKELSESVLEAELVIEIWKTRKLAGTLREQIQEALAIATYKRKESQNNELKRALLNKDGINKDGSEAQRKSAPLGEPKINATDKTVLRGYIWDGIKGAYKKKLSSGKTLFVSRDLKKRWIE